MFSLLLFCRIHSFEHGNKCSIRLFWGRSTIVWFAGRIELWLLTWFRLMFNFWDTLTNYRHQHIVDWLMMRIMIWNCLLDGFYHPWARLWLNIFDRLCLVLEVWDRLLLWLNVATVVRQRLRFIVWLDTRPDTPFGDGGYRLLRLASSPGVFRIWIRALIWWDARIHTLFRVFWVCVSLTPISVGNRAGLRVWSGVRFWLECHATLWSAWARLFTGSEAWLFTGSEAWLFVISCVRRARVRSFTHLFVRDWAWTLGRVGWTRFSAFMRVRSVVRLFEWSRRLWFTATLGMSYGWFSVR